MATLQNQLPTISEMDQLVGFGTRSETVDNYGALVVTLPQITQSVRAKVRFEKTDEREQEKQEKFTREIKVWVRYPQAVTLTDEYMVYWDSSYWDIYAVEWTPRKRFYVLKCRNITE